MSGRITMAWRLSCAWEGLGKEREKRRKQAQSESSWAKSPLTIAALSLMFPQSPSDRSCLLPKDALHSPGGGGAAMGWKELFQRLVLCCSTISWSCAIESKCKMAWEKKMQCGLIIQDQISGNECLFIEPQHWPNIYEPRISSSD